MKKLLSKSRFLNKYNAFTSFSCSSRRYSTSTLSSIIKPEQIDLINEQKILFDDIYTNVNKLNMGQDVLDLIVDSKNKIDDLFMVVVVGEFNAGKSTFINALLGDTYLQEGVLPTTSKIGILRGVPAHPLTESSSSSSSSPNRNEWRRAENILLVDVEEIDIPVDWLQHIAIIDTPGTNAIISKHEILTQKIVPRADLVLFVTSAERPITESESVFLNKIAQWGKKVVLIVNKIDIIETVEDRKLIVDYVSQNASKALGRLSSSSSSFSSMDATAGTGVTATATAALPIFAVSGKQGLTSKLVNKRDISNKSQHPAQGAGAKLYQLSQIGDIENYLKTLLGEQELIRNKLMNSLMVADHIISDAFAIIEKRKQYVQSDQRILEFVNENMTHFLTDLDRDLKYYKQLVQVLLSKFEKRTTDYLDRNVGVKSHHYLWFDKKQLAADLRNEVLTDILKPLEDIIREVSDLVASRCKSQAQAVLEYVNQRHRRFSDNLDMNQTNTNTNTNIHDGSGDRVNSFNKNIDINKPSSEHMIGSIDYDANFEKTRMNMLNHLQESISEIIHTNNTNEHYIEFLTQKIQDIYFHSFILQTVTICSLGALYVTHMIDATSAALLSTSAFTSMALITYQKNSLKIQFQSKLSALQQKLDDAIHESFERGKNNGSTKILGNVAPYTRYVKTEQNLLKSVLENLNVLKNKVSQIKKGIN